MMSSAVNRELIEHYVHVLTKYETHQKDLIVFRDKATLSFKMRLCSSYSTRIWFANIVSIEPLDVNSNCYQS